MVHVFHPLALSRSVNCMSVFSLLFVFIIRAASGYYLYLHSKRLQKHTRYYRVFVPSTNATHKNTNGNTE